MKTTAIAGLALILAATPLIAQDRGGFGRGMERPDFSEFDADGDGLVTEAEINAHGDARFADLDANGDGNVSSDEFVARAVARATERAEAMFDRLDADGDGLLSRDAVEAQRGRGPGAERIIARLDTDEDGAISEEEFEAFKGRHARAGKRHGGKKSRHN